MGTVTGFTAARMKDIEDGTVVDGYVNASGELILQKFDGTEVNAGLVKGAPGDPGPAGLNWRGAWSATTAYAVRDAVLYGSSSYRRLVAGTTSGTPDVDTTNWYPIALGTTPPNMMTGKVGYAKDVVINSSGRVTIVHNLGTVPRSLGYNPVNTGTYRVVEASVGTNSFEIHCMEPNGTTKTAGQNQSFYWQVWL